MLFYFIKLFVGFYTLSCYLQQWNIYQLEIKVCLPISVFIFKVIIPIGRQIEMSLGLSLGDGISLGDIISPTQSPLQKKLVGDRVRRLFCWNAFPYV